MSISTDGGKTFTNRTTANGLGVNWEYPEKNSNEVSDVYVRTVPATSNFYGKVSMPGINGDRGKTIYKERSDQRWAVGDPLKIIYAGTANGLAVSINDDNFVTKRFWAEDGGGLATKPIATAVTAFTVNNSGTVLTAIQPSSILGSTGAGFTFLYDAEDFWIQDPRLGREDQILFYQKTVVKRNGGGEPGVKFDFTKLDSPDGIRIQYPDGSIGDADASVMGREPLERVSAVALDGDTVYLGTPAPNGLFIWHRAPRLK